MPRPKARGLLVPQFATLAAAMDALAACLELRPVGRRAAGPDAARPGRRQPGAARHDGASIQGRPAALFMVEFCGDDAGRGRRPRRRTADAAAGRPGLIAAVPALDPAHARPALEPAQGRDAAALRHARRPQAGHVRRGHRRRPERLPEFVARFREILHAARHRRRVLRPRQRRLPAHPAGAQPQGPGRRGAHAARSPRRSPTWCSSSAAALSAASTATAWPAASGTARCSARRSTTPSARSSTPSTRTTCSTPARSSTRPPMTENLRYRPGYHPAEPADRLRLLASRRASPAPSRCATARRLPQDAGRDDVPVVPGHAATRRTARAAGPTPCGWRWPASSRCEATARSDAGCTRCSTCA